MLEPGTDRVRLDPLSRPLDPITYPPEGFRIVSSSDGSVEMHVGGAGSFGWFLYLVLVALIVIFGRGLHATAIEIVGWVIVASLLLLTLLVFGDGGVHLTRVWRFRPGRVIRVMRLPMPARIWPRQFADVDDFEIAHTLWTKGIFSRRLHGGHQDTLRFGTRGSSRQVTVLTRGEAYSGATLRGGLFTQDQASEIEREILPDVLLIAALASQAVGAPLYVIEKTSYVGSDSDG